MSYAHGYYAFPKLEGDIGPHMTSGARRCFNWSLNNYLGLANHPEVRKADAEGAAQFGMAALMGARMMSGQTVYHERLERELAEFVGKEDAFLLNFGYQGMISIIDRLLTPRDVVVYDAEAHACIIDGLRLHKGKLFVYGHNDMESLRLQLQHATDLAEEQNGGVLVITEGVFGMKGDLGKLDEIVAPEKGISSSAFWSTMPTASAMMGEGGRGTASHFGVVGRRRRAVQHLCQVDGRYRCIRLRPPLADQPAALQHAFAALRQVAPDADGYRCPETPELIRNHPEYQQKLWEIVRVLQSSLKENGFEIGVTNSARDARFPEGRHPRGYEPGR